MHPKQFESVLQLSTTQRYDYFIGKVTDFEEVWGLYADDWASIKSEDKKEMIPFFPQSQFAEHYGNTYFPTHKVRSLSIYEFIEQLLPAFQTKQLLVSIFPIDESDGIVDIETLKKDLEMEIQSYL